MVLIAQQANAQNIPTEIRSQMSLRVGLGKQSSQERVMTFGDGYEYPSVEAGIGRGLFYLDGLTNNPRLIECTDLSQLGEKPFAIFSKAINYYRYHNGGQ